MPSRRRSASGRRSSWPSSTSRPNATLHLSLALSGRRSNHDSSGTVPSASWYKTTLVLGTSSSSRVFSIMRTHVNREIRLAEPLHIPWPGLLGRDHTARLGGRTRRRRHRPTRAAPCRPPPFEGEAFSIGATVPRYRRPRLGEGTAIVPVWVADRLKTLQATRSPRGRLLCESGDRARSADGRHESHNVPFWPRSTRKTRNGSGSPAILSAAPACYQ